MLTKEKLRHYLAFECPIREITAVSDRHCSATDSPHVHARGGNGFSCTDLRGGVYRSLCFSPLFFVSVSVSVILSFSIALTVNLHAVPAFYLISCRLGFRRSLSFCPSCNFLPRFCFISIIQFVLSFARALYSAPASIYAFIIFLTPDPGQVPLCISSTSREN